MEHQLPAFTEDRTTTQFSVAIYRVWKDSPPTVITTGVGPDRDRVEAYAVRCAENYPKSIVWVVTRVLVTPAWKDATLDL